MMATADGGEWSVCVSLSLSIGHFPTTRQRTGPFQGKSETLNLKPLSDSGSVHPSVRLSAFRTQKEQTPRVGWSGMGRTQTATPVQVSTSPARA